MFTIFKFISSKISYVYKSILKYWKSLYITSKFIFLTCTVCFFSICYSIFDTDTVLFDNFETLRTAFSSIMGYLLEDSSKRLIDCNDKFLFIRNFFVGFIAFFICILLWVSHNLKTDTANPSLILFKNILFSCIGFLISSTRDCEEDFEKKDNE